MKTRESHVGWASALCTYSPVRTAAAEAAPSESRVFFCAASGDDDIKAIWQGALVSRKSESWWVSDGTMACAKEQDGVRVRGRMQPGYSG